jgi:hypothetical protein
LGLPAISLFGKDPAKDRLDVIPHLVFDRVYVLLDADAQEAAMKLTFTLRKRHPEMSVFRVPGENLVDKDPDEVSEEKLCELFEPYRKEGVL